MTTLSSVARSVPLLGSRGFEFRETMAGWHELKRAPRAGERLPFSFTVRAHADSLADFFFGNGRKGVVALTGEALPGGFSEKAVQLRNGRLEFHPGRRRGMLVYAFEFTGEDGRDYSFYGEKSRRGLDLVKSFTTLEGILREKQSGEIVAKGTTRFDMKDLREFLASYKLTG